MGPWSRPWYAVLVACSAALAACSPPPAPDATPPSLAAVEALYQETRALRDAIDVTRSRGAVTSTQGAPLGDLLARYALLRAELARTLAPPGPPPGSEEDARALEAMRAGLARDLVEESAAAPDGGEDGKDTTVDCGYDAEQLVGSEGSSGLSTRIYACFSRAAHSLWFEGEPTDRLTVLGRVTMTPDAPRREALWRALAPIWESVNGDNGRGSPYRTLVRANAARLRDEGKTLGDPVRAIGVDPEQMEAWLIQVLESWRAIAPAAPIEPWDFGHAAGEAQRALGPAVPLASLRPINDRFYADLGADPVALLVQYDLEPRPDKNPVAFTTFGRRPRLTAGGVIPGEPWVFASYRMGGLDNLGELLHETGHAVHIAAIRTRPAFSDWPDSDIFTEALADVAALELYEPAWQQRYLGSSVPIETGIRARYAGIAMDVAWALFELRVHREPERDPNQVWTEITSRYFRIAPHPELAWWAVRGQLVDAPGYMMNYAAGAILCADLRARLRELYGPFAEGDPGWYARAAASLYRFGLERPSRQVIEDFLGRPISPQALLDDLARAGSKEAD